MIIVSTNSISIVTQFSLAAWCLHHSVYIYIHIYIGSDDHNAPAVKATTRLPSKDLPNLLRLCGCVSR